MSERGSDRSVPPVRRPGWWRDRHDRGPRGPLAPPDVPLSRSRSQRFDDLVLDAVERLERDWADQLASVEFAVEDVPPELPAGLADVPLGRSAPGRPPRPPQVVVYRRPVEARAVGRDDLAALVRQVVVEQVADLLGRSPEEVDPGYDEG